MEIISFFVFYCIFKGFIRKEKLYSQLFAGPAVLLGRIENSILKIVDLALGCFQMYELY